MSKKQTKMQKYEPQALAKAEQSLEALTKLYPEGDWNLLVPQMMVSTLPEGTRLVATRIDISVNERDGEVYKVPFGKLAIGKAKLNEISKALGAKWGVSRRVGDRRNPHYIEWEVVGEFMQPDGSTFPEHANKTIDLRADIGDGTPGADVQEIMRTAAKKERDPSDEITKARQNIQMLAETKAKNRAIRAAAAMKTSYTAHELAKPFLAVKLAIDPKSEIGSRAIVQQLAGATASMYGPAGAKVVDATFEEPTVDEDPPTPTDGEEEVGGDGVPSAASSDSEEPPLDEETGEAVGTKEVIAKIMAVWMKAQAGGMASDTFKALAETQTGKAKKEDMTLSDAESIGQAVSEFLAEKASPV